MDMETACLIILGVIYHAMQMMAKDCLTRRKSNDDGWVDVRILIAWKTMSDVNKVYTNLIIGHRGLLL